MMSGLQTQRNVFTDSSCVQLIDSSSKWGEAKLHTFISKVPFVERRDGLDHALQCSCHVTNELRQGLHDAKTLACTPQFGPQHNTTFMQQFFYRFANGIFAVGRADAGNRGLRGSSSLSL
jgi:hypothetical protein